ncbi:MAG: chemotaxis protein CheW [Pseudomonadales bacterium]|nr:chemotaxis protein CheW [Pseudomonadales bacterium]
MADANVSRQQEVVNSLLFQMHNSLLVLPDTAIAEIVEYPSSVDEDEGQESWYIGKMAWRNISVPLISFDRMNGVDIPHEAYKVVVVNAVHNRDQMLYWAFVIAQAPRMQHINNESLAVIRDAELGDVTVMQAELLGEEVVLPDLQKIEDKIQAL